MQTMYYKTSNFIRHSGNIVDLNLFRQKQALAQQDSLARQIHAGGWPQEDGEGTAPAFQPVVLTTTPAQRRRARRERQAWRLDICASLAVIFMTVVFALWVMF